MSTYKEKCVFLADANTAPVTVMVQDVNDNAPQFVSSTLEAAVAEEADFGTTITTLMVHKNKTYERCIYCRVIQNLHT